MISEIVGTAGYMAPEVISVYIDMNSIRNSNINIQRKQMSILLE